MNFEQPTFAERCGLVAGGWLAPLTAAVSARRRARMFHPEGVTYLAEVAPSHASGELAAAANRLAGTALARFSTALWRGGREWPDVLGVALRFDGAQSSAQDLLLATVRFPWTTPFAPLATRVHTFAWNHYHAVSPFELDGVGPVKLRLRSPRIANPTAQNRVQHLSGLAGEGRARFILECRRLALSVFARRWEPLAGITLREPVDVDQEALRFSPFRDGAGIHPRGFVHALRVAAYRASQEARPAHGFSVSSALALQGQRGVDALGKPLDQRG
ncbi:MAG TPA: hypothetical protein VFZ53_13180 [Polyangiaceae bacterium]